MQPKSKYFYPMVFTEENIKNTVFSVSAVRMSKSLEEIKGVYAHYKNPENHYQVTGVAYDTERKEKMVLYACLYTPRDLTIEEYGDPIRFTRPYSNFFEMIEVDGKMVQRFVKI